MPTVIEMTRQAEAAIASGDKVLARQLLKQALQQEPKNEKVLMLYADVAERFEYAIHCLETVLALNPNNQEAREKLRLVQGSSGSRFNDVSAPAPIPSPLVAHPPGGSPVISTVSCPHCGKANQTDATFCGYCGGDLRGGASKTVILNPVIPVVTQPVAYNQTGVNVTVHTGSDKSEQVIYEDSSVLITNARAVINAKTYAMANITSVAQGEIEPNNIVAVASGVISAVTCAVAVLVALISLIVLFGGNIVGGRNIFFIAIFIGIVGVFGFWFARAIWMTPTYIVKIWSSSGEAHALYSKNKLQVQSIIAAINEAIVKRG